MSNSPHAAMLLRLKVLQNMASLMRFGRKETYQFYEIDAKKTTGVVES